MSATSIVVGIDGSEHSLEALRLGLFLAGASDARLLVASVSNVDPYNPGRLGAEDALRRRVEGMLHSCEPAVAASVDWEPRVLEDSTVAHGLHLIAERDNADLLVVGSTHRGAIRRVVPGSVGRRIVHGAPCPVAVAPSDYRAPEPGEPALVAAAFDGSPESAHAVGAAAMWAAALGAELHVIRVLELPDPANPIYGGVSYADTVRRLRQQADRSLGHAVAGLHVAAGITPELREGEPAAVLARQSERYTLLFMGSRGYGSLRRVLLGTVSAELVDLAACPLVILPRTAETPLPSVSAPAIVEER